MFSSVLSFFFEFGVFFSCAMVVSSKNPIHSILFLVLMFCNSAGLLVLSGAEFISMVLIVVYVGAIAVLFLFVVMMLDIRFLESRREFLLYFPVGVVVLFSFSAMFFLIFYKAFSFSYFYPYDLALSFFVSRTDNLFVFGSLLYTYFFLFFLLSGLILLVAMVGAILLTFSSYSVSRKQLYSSQVFRRPEILYVY